MLLFLAGFLFFRANRNIFPVIWQKFYLLFKLYVNYSLSYCLFFLFLVFLSLFFLFIFGYFMALRYYNSNFAPIKA
jgi:hypothetical protein